MFAVFVVLWTNFLLKNESFSSKGQTTNREQHERRWNEQKATLEISKDSKRSITLPLLFTTLTITTLTTKTTYFSTEFEGGYCRRETLLYNWSNDSMRRGYSKLNTKAVKFGILGVLETGLHVCAFKYMAL